VPTRRTLLTGALAAAGPLRGAHAADYPRQDIKFIIPLSVGGGFDLYARAVAPGIASRLPNAVQVVPDNVPAGGGVLGAGQLYRARPDGYTIGILNIPGMFVLQQSGGGSFNLEKFSWIGATARDTYAIAVGQESPLKSIADLKALSAERPVKFTTTGREGTAYSALVISMHLLGVRTQIITGYKGSAEYVVAAIRGDGDAVVSDMPVIRQMVAGKLMRVLATFETHSTFPGADDATSLGLPELTDLAVERLVAGPPKLPPAIQQTLSEALAGALTEPAVVDLAKRAGSTLRPLTPAQTAALVAKQSEFYDKWKSLLEPT
jgi:tripartite-type tricarboxylate transporter receptor subunit TctC